MTDPDEASGPHCCSVPHIQSRCESLTSEASTASHASHDVAIGPDPATTGPRHHERGEPHSADLLQLMTGRTAPTAADKGVTRQGPAPLRPVARQLFGAPVREELVGWLSHAERLQVS